MKALIDGDIIVYSCGFASDKREKQPDGTYIVSPEPVGHCLHTVKKLIKSILETTKADSYEIFLTGEGNYRETIATIKPYKGNRDPALKPYWYKEMKDYLKTAWHATTVEGREADDAMGCAQWSAEKETTIICSLDKDMQMIPGLHYNWRKGFVTCVEHEDAIRNFYYQLLVGDPTDNIQGVPGIGKKKAEKLLPIASKLTELEMFEIVLGAYHRAFPDGTHLAKMKENAILLWIQREEGKTWVPPEGAILT